jgi:5-methylcytosine-specific restriction endonuclease McrA
VLSGNLIGAVAFDEALAHAGTGAIPPSTTKPSRKATIPHSLRTAVMERDRYRCQHCGGWEDLSIDHIVPEVVGGPTEFGNLQVLCRPCNSSKGTTTPLPEG